jgi:hypothetical protein
VPKRANSCRGGFILSPKGGMQRDQLALLGINKIDEFSVEKKHSIQRTGFFSPEY